MPGTEEGTRQECKTCYRYRPLAEFQLLVGHAQSGRAVHRGVKICRLCREKLWVNAGDPFEGQ